MIDKRVIERQIRKGKLDASAYQRTLEGLPDLADRVARDTGEEPTRSASAPRPHVSAEPSSSAHDAPDSADDLDDDIDDDEEDDEDDDEDAAPEASDSV